MLPAIGNGAYDTDSHKLDEALRLLRLIDRDAKPAVAAVVMDASRRLAELTLTESAASPLASGAFTAAVQMAERFPEMSPMVDAIQQNAMEIARLQVSLWRLHMPAELPDTLPVLLRLSTDRSRVETSKGQEVPVAICERIWRVSQLAQQLGRALTEDEYLHEGGAAVGAFSLVQVDACGSITVSCHRLGIDEINKIADDLSFTPTQ
ncbi:hypothetical protein [Rhodanobacter sp. A1T4]|uniref:hypothetical protein n=1 Tax=Rhodanobacter sp. A1T4 TaxID=2723087 RepID=UPI00160729D8|nr:hypothetical protein [Rhodanobacter sp. A1T4]MBB6246341.1 hypothetical protein [Rhodanobacter sp. A1T4]